MNYSRQWVLIFCAVWSCIVTRFGVMSVKLPHLVCNSSIPVHAAFPQLLFYLILQVEAAVAVLKGK